VPLLGPKLFLVFALIFAAGYALLPRKAAGPGPKQRAAADWVAGRLDERRPEAALLAGGAEQLKSGGQAQADAVTAVYEKPSAPEGTGPTGPAELTAEILLRAMEQVIATVPKIVPGLPLLPGMARHFMARDPGMISFEPMPPNILGKFTTADPDKPRIVLNKDLQRLHAKGVPPELLADVLVHELDHMLAYLLGRAPRRTRQQNEISAFVAEGYYLTALRGSGKGAVVDAQPGDPETEAYYEELKKVRRKLLAGELPQLIRDTYGPEPVGHRRR
jgi:hypothetical protein